MRIPNIVSKAYNSLSWPPFAVGRKIYHIIKSVDQSRIFLKHFVLKTLFTSTLNYLLFNIKNQLLDNCGKLNNYVINSLGKENIDENEFENFKNEVINISYPILQYIIIGLVLSQCDIIYKWTATKLKHIFNQKIFNDKQVGLKLSNSEEIGGILRNIPYDVDAVINEGFTLIQDAIMRLQNAFLSFVNLYRLSNNINILGIPIPDLLFISFAFSTVQQGISWFITNFSTSYNDQYNLEMAKKHTIISHDFSNIKPIFTATAQNSVAEKYKNLLDKLSILEVKLNTANSVHKVWLTSTYYINLAFQNLVIGYKVYNNTLHCDEVYTGISHFYNVSKLLSWTQTNQIRIRNLEPRLDRLKTILTKEKEILEISSGVKYKQSDLLILSDLCLSTSDKTLFDNINMTFKLQERYVFSGKSGSGKSSLLAKINGIIHDGISATGTIYSPSDKRIMLTQDDYFPTYSNILDVLCLPDKAPTDYKTRELLKSKARTLLDKANFGRTIDFEEIKINWSALLSGGEKKKIKIISAILQNPKLLLLDEVFVGLDEESVKKMQKIIKDELRSTTIISVDHHADSSKEFYTSHYNIENGKIKHISGIKIESSPPPEPTKKPNISRRKVSSALNTNSNLAYNR